MTTTARILNSISEIDAADWDRCANPGAAVAHDPFLRHDFLLALENPLYKTPEFAYTNAAICLLKIDRQDDAKEYLRKALAARSNFGAALLAMGDVSFDQSDFANARIYLQRYHQVAAATPRSLWLAIRIELELGGAGSGTIERLGKELEDNFADSDEYREWRKIR